MPPLNDLTIEWNGTVTLEVSTSIFHLLHALADKVCQSAIRYGERQSYRCLARNPLDATDSSCFEISIANSVAPPTGATIAFVGNALCPARNGLTFVTAEQVCHLTPSLATLAHESMNVIGVVGRGEVLRRESVRPDLGTDGWWCLWVRHNVWLPSPVTDESQQSGQILQFGVLYTDREGIISGLATEVCRVGTVISLVGTVLKYAQQERVWIVIVSIQLDTFV
ncbi:uncharacterized protein MELLADRAFT_59424 [Melampsora larici-populina 98AG31]|uniref:Uncharacterized protein n=1 Tax=Melampsora larici-populina (strain 98AG31 / pathotype 3-4-7) TaxID=747676 RepID=F4R7F4_MELLP|nr:uncharacterized protein MELLADRAFT_59424 [Melampsora larici-populina 98AG31]EGG11796.1 hypothetical protein MELLADRAFT_59424 [Melampsora larici-populina 98AG31]